ncbi:hypothetical protein PFISCL1PPCAC_12526, partial [Pristionchus fissidentatus]
YLRYSNSRRRQRLRFVFDIQKMTRDMQNSVRKIPQDWKEFPNAIRRCAWEVVSTDAFKSYPRAAQSDLFVRLSGAMKSHASVHDETEVAECSYSPFMKALARAHIVMAHHMEMIVENGWIDAPLTGEEPYSDGTFPEKEEDEEQPIMEEAMDTVVKEEKKDTVVKEEEVEDTVLKKEIKEEVVEDEGEDVNMIEKNNEQIPLFYASGPAGKTKRVRRKYGDDMSADEIEPYFDRASSEAIDGSNFTNSEKNQLKLAMKDVMLRGLNYQFAAVKYCTPGQRIIAFSCKIKQICKRLKKMEESGELPSTSSHPIPTLDATPEQKLIYVNYKIDEIVSGSTLKRNGRALLKRAVRLVVWDGLSIAAASNRTGLAASTMFPYVVKARSALSGLLQMNAPGPSTVASTALMCGADDDEEQGSSNDASEEEIRQTVEGVLASAQITEERRKMLSRVMVTALMCPKESTKIAACRRENISVTSVAPYLARARARLENRPPATRISTDEMSFLPREDSMEGIDESEYIEKGSVVIEGYLLPNSCSEIRRQIRSGELSHVKAKPFEGTRKMLRDKIVTMIAKFRYRNDGVKIADGIMAVIIDHKSHDKVVEELGVANASLIRYKAVVKLLIDMKNITLFENGIKRKIKPNMKIENGQKNKYLRDGARGKKIQVEKSDDDCEGTEEDSD